MPLNPPLRRPGASEPITSSNGPVGFQRPQSPMEQIFKCSGKCHSIGKLVRERTNKTGILFCDRDSTGVRHETLERNARRLIYRMGYAAGMHFPLPVPILVV